MNHRALPPRNTDGVWHNKYTINSKALAKTKHCHH